MGKKLRLMLFGVGELQGLIKKALRKLGLQGVKKKNRCY
jgi:hypothetical protein